MGNCGVRFAPGVKRSPAKQRLGVWWTARKIIAKSVQRLIAVKHSSVDLEISECLHFDCMFLLSLGTVTLSIEFHAWFFAVDAFAMKGNDVFCVIIVDG